MFSSPNDYSNYFSNSANWLRTAGVTVINKHFSYLNLLDEVVPFNKQLKNLQGLGLFPLYYTVHVDASPAPYSNSHCLYTTQTPGAATLYHNATTKFSLINNIVWTYLLTSYIATDIKEVTNDMTLSIYSNPTCSIVTLYSNHSLFNKPFDIQNTQGQSILSGQSSNVSFFSIDLSTLERGIYFIIIDDKKVKIIKE